LSKRLFDPAESIKLNNPSFHLLNHYLYIQRDGVGGPIGEPVDLSLFPFQWIDFAFLFEAKRITRGKDRVKGKTSPSFSP